MPSPHDAHGMLYHGVPEGHDAVRELMHFLLTISACVPEGQVATHDFVVASSYEFTGQAPDTVQTLTPVIVPLVGGGALIGLLGGQEAAATHFCVSGSHTGVAPEHAVTH